LNAGQPLLALIGEITRRSDCRQVFIQKNGFALRLEKRDPRQAQPSDNSLGESTMEDRGSQIAQPLSNS
jgi:hypothetical protein